MTAKAPATRSVDDTLDFDHAAFDKLVRQLADVISVPYQQLKAVVEQGALVTRLRPRRESYEHLREVKITISQAAKKYSTPRTTVSDWTDKGYITVLDAGYPKQLDEADVAFCVAVKAHRESLGITRVVPFFDDAGEPVYETKYEASLLRRRETTARVGKPQVAFIPASAARVASASTRVRKVALLASNSRRPRR